MIIFHKRRKVENLLTDGIMIKEENDVVRDGDLMFSFTKGYTFPDRVKKL